MKTTYQLHKRKTVFHIKKLIYPSFSTIKININMLQQTYSQLKVLSFKELHHNYIYFHLKFYFKMRKSD
jgi:hypothetical protein